MAHRKILRHSHSNWVPKTRTLRGKCPRNAEWESEEERERETGFVFSLTNFCLHVSLNHIDLPFFFFCSCIATVVMSLILSLRSTILFSRCDRVPWKCVSPLSMIVSAVGVACCGGLLSSLYGCHFYRLHISVSLIASISFVFHFSHVGFLFLLRLCWVFPQMSLWIPPSLCVFSIHTIIVGGFSHAFGVMILPATYIRALNYSTDMDVTLVVHFYNFLCVYVCAPKQLVSPFLFWWQRALFFVRFYTTLVCRIYLCASSMLWISSFQRAPSVSDSISSTCIRLNVVTHFPAPFHKAFLHMQVF